MNANSFLLPLAAGLVLSAAPALAQYGEGHGKAAEKGGAANAIAEGTVKDGVRTVEMAVTDKGFEPAQVKVKKGEKLRFVITRKTDVTCATEIVIPDHGINTALPLGKAVTVELTPKKSGEIRYACGMGHVNGIIFVP